MSRTLAYRNLLTQSAINFRNLIATQNVYLFLGKDTPWPDENNPTQPTGCSQCEKNTRSAFLYFKKLSIEDSALGTDKFTWTYGTIYDQYVVDDPLLYTKKFYVITNSGNVYKCLSNNNGAESTIIPTGTGTQILITADGYQWKFMYNISVPVSEKFTSQNTLVIPTDDQKTQNQILVENTAVENVDSPVGGHGKNAAMELFANSTIINKSIILQTSSMPSIEHRQVGIIVSPKLVSGEDATADEYFISNNEIDTNSGMLVCKTNHIVVSSDEVPEETIQIILKF